MRRDYDALKAQLLERIERAGALDGAYLALHGSMRVEDMAESPEGDLLGSVRQLLPDARLAASFDLHANISASIVEPLDVLQSFRANPHWDLFPTGYRAGRTLFAALRDAVAPVSAWRKLPIVLGGGVGISFLEPAVRRVDSRECGRIVHIDLGDVQLVASERPPLSAHPRFYRTVGIEPRRADAIVQKSFFQYRLMYLGTSHHHVPVATPGPSDLHGAAHRPFPHPVVPESDPPDWRAFDRIQRGLAE